MLKLLHPSLLLSQLLKFIFFCEFLHHIPPKLSLHPGLFLFLKSFALFSLPLSSLHLEALPFTLFHLLLLFSSHLSLILLLVKFTSQAV